MTQFSFVVIFNPISTWTTPTDYSIGDQVEDLSVFYRAKTDHTSSGGNRPPSSDWDVITPTSPNQIITNDIETLKEIEIGSGEVRSLSLRFNANQGAFITNTNSGDTPIIDEYDRIKIAITDGNNVTYSATYEVINIKPVQDAVQGTVLPVELMGPEFYLIRTMFAEQFFFKSMFFASEGICNFYNANKGTLQPRIINHDNNSTSGGFNDLPKWTANDYLFNLSETNHYDGLINVMDRGGSSVASSGAGDFFEIGFESDARPELLKFRGFSSGNPSDQTIIPNIIDTTATNPGEEEGGIESTKGTVVGTWCADGVGFLPRQNADFIGGLEAWPLFPAYVAGELYPSGAIILVPNTLDSQGDNFHYKANKDTLIAPPTPPTASNADWDQYQFTSFLTTEVGHSPSNYSLWTSARAVQWKSNGAKTDGSLEDDPPLATSMAVWDSNLVIVDGKFARTWVDVRALNEAAIPGKFLRNGQVYRGFRVLVDGVGTAEFAGFDNFVIQWSGTEWLIFKRPANDEMVAVDNEAKVYQLLTGTWTDISTSLDQSKDCYHPVFNITNTQGHNAKNSGGTGNFGEISAVTYEFRYSRLDSTLGPLFDVELYYRLFAGACFRVPYPFNTDNGNIVGNDYGDNDSREPATFEAANMNLTSSGFSGFNNVEAEDLGPFDALTFNIKHVWRYGKLGDGPRVQDGNFAYRCTLYDIDDGVIKQDFTIPVNGLWEPISLPIGSFEPYEARSPWAFGNIGQNIFLQGIEVLKKFRWRNIKKISIHWLGPYDNQGRYNPNGQGSFIAPSIEDIASGNLFQDYNVKLSIDSFAWAKPGLSLSPPVTDRPLMPPFFEEPLISNLFQNSQANLAKLEIMKFRHKQYEFTMQGDNSIRFGDSVFLENKFLVKESDRTINDVDAWVTATDYFINDDVKDLGVIYRCIKDHTSAAGNKPPAAEFWVSLGGGPIPNTIKLVIKKIEKNIDKLPSGSPSGLLYTFTGVKRFE